jgi:hypothetical protein
MFSDRAKLIALAIVHVFETSRPFGDYSAVAVLDDGAGVSYGINQFTHKSGSLYTVLNTYLGIGGTIGADEFEACMPTLRLTTKAAIAKLSNDKTFKNLLKAAGKTPEMQLAQQQVMENSYLLPAIDAAEGSHFELPLRWPSSTIPSITVHTARSATACRSAAHSSAITRRLRRPGSRITFASGMNG